MKTKQQVRGLMTPEQAAEYLQVNRETIYRYIREGRLVASRLGRTYRIPWTSIEMFLWSTRTREDVSLREYSAPEIEEFIERDQLDEGAQAIADQFLASTTGQRRPEDSEGKTKHARSP